MLLLLRVCRTHFHIWLHVCQFSKVVSLGFVWSFDRWRHQTIWVRTHEEFIRRNAAQASLLHNRRLRVGNTPDAPAGATQFWTQQMLQNRRSVAASASTRPDPIRSSHISISTGAPLSLEDEVRGRRALLPASGMLIAQANASGEQQPAGQISSRRIDVRSQSAERQLEHRQEEPRSQNKSKTLMKTDKAEKPKTKHPSF